MCQFMFDYNTHVYTSIFVVISVPFETLMNTLKLCIIYLLGGLMAPYCHT